VLKRFRTSLGFDRQGWLLLLAMLAFRFGQGLFYPYSAIHFHNVVGIPLSLVGTGLGTLAAASVVVAGALLEAQMPHIIWIIQLTAAGLAAIGLVALK
jgi:hypothetical protein